jgi:hypothetical protein
MYSKKLSEVSPVSSRFPTRNYAQSDSEPSGDEEEYEADQSGGGYKGGYKDKDQLEINFFKYRIVAHIIYYMLKAYLAGYIHKDLHAGNIYVLNVTESFNTCIHPFSLNDWGSKQLQGYTEMLFTELKISIDKIEKNDCNIIQNFCNMSCIEIIDWGRTQDIGVNEENNAFIIEPTFEKLITIINKLKNIYEKNRFGYLFNLVGFENTIATDNIDYPQFYVLWLIYNELKFKTKFQKDKCSDKSKSTEEIKDANLNEYLKAFDQRCNSDPFYEIFTLHEIVDVKR